MIKINFDKLLQDYDSDLITKLRGFNDQYDYLQYWVPGSDKTTSLINLIDSMYESNILNFLILISGKDKYLINEIKKNHSGISKIESKQNGFEYEILIELDKKNYQLDRARKKNINQNLNIKTYTKISQLEEKRENYDLLQCYEKSLENYHLKFNEKENLIDENTFFENIDDDHKLFIKINSKSKKIIECFHNFREANNKSSVVDKFCELAKNKHIQEAKDHGLIYLEYTLRPDEVKKEIKGIIFPKKVGGFLLDLQKCINKIYGKIKEKYNFVDIINKEYPSLSKDWINTEHDKKIEKLKKILHEKIIPLLNLKNEDVTVSGIESDTRVVIRLSADFTSKNFQERNYLIMIEDLFKKLVDNRLELCTIEKKDINLLRHTNSPQKIKS